MQKNNNYKGNTASRSMRWDETLASVYVRNQNKIKITEFSIDALLKANPHGEFKQGQIYNMQLSDGSLAEITLPCSILVINEKYYLIEPSEISGIKKSCYGNKGYVFFAREAGLHDKIPISGYSDNDYCLAIKENTRIPMSPLSEGEMTAKARGKTEIIENPSCFVMDRIRGVPTDKFIADYNCKKRYIYDKDSLVLHIARLYLNELSELYKKGIVHGHCTLDNTIFDPTKNVLTILNFSYSACDEEKKSNSDEIDKEDYLYVKSALYSLADSLTATDSFLAKSPTIKKTQERIKKIADALSPTNTPKLKISQAVELLKEMEEQLKLPLMEQKQTDAQLFNKFGLFQNQNSRTEEHVVSNVPKAKMS